MPKMLVAFVGLVIAVKIALDFLRKINESSHDGRDHDC